MKLLTKSLSQTRLRSLKLANLTLRDLGGGLNAVDNDLSMDVRYFVTLNNFRRTPGGSQRSRFGTRWFADCSKGNINEIFTIPGGGILDMEYFAARIIAVGTLGQIIAITDLGVKSRIWDNTIAALLPGAPLGWSPAPTVDFVPFKNQLILHNGIDKPITISQALAVTYLKDLGSGSNTNVPIGKYGCVVANYHCVAGIPAAPTTVYVSAAGTAGTFPGDPPPNDAISIDVGAYAPEGASDIRGIGGYRNFLIVFFQKQALIVELGNYEGSPPVHVPKFPDTLPRFGLHGHRCLVSVRNDLRFAGLTGIASAKRNLFSAAGSIEAETLSDRIQPEYKRKTGILTDAQLLQSCFMNHDQNAEDTLTFVPGGEVFVYSESEKLKYQSWSKYVGVNATASCSSFLGRVFLAEGNKIYQSGNTVFDGEDFHADKLLDRNAVWTGGTQYQVNDLVFDEVDGKSYRALVQHISGVDSFATDRTNFPDRWEEYTGEPISVEMEFPWLDGRDPMQTKQLMFISIATKGTGKFTVKAYVDNLYKDAAGVVQFDPALSMDFIGNDAVGFGFDAGPYGGGRRSNDPRLFKFPLKFKTLKIVITGEMKDLIEIVHLAFLYFRGKYGR